jgi:hypothetical protein
MPPGDQRLVRRWMASFTHRNAVDGAPESSALAGIAHHLASRRVSGFWLLCDGLVGRILGASLVRFGAISRSSVFKQPKRRPFHGTQWHAGLTIGFLTHIVIFSLHSERSVRHAAYR